MRKQKDEELEQYKKDIERQKRFENQKASGVSVGNTDKIIVKRKVGAGTTAGGAIQRVKLNKQ